MSAASGGVAPAAAEARRPVVFWAWLGVTAATFCWSSNVVAVKYIVREIPPFPAGLMRISLAACALAGAHLWQRKRFLIRPADRSRLLQVGIAGVACSFLFFTLAMAHTSVAHAVFIGALVPMAVLLLARLEGQERITPAKLGGLLICLLGVLLLALDQANGSEGNWLGDLWAFGALWCFAFFTVRSKRLTDYYDSVSLNTFAFLIAALFCLPFLFWSLSTIPWEQITWRGWTALAYSATVGSAGAYLSYYYSLRTLTATQVAAFQYVQPVLSTAFGVLLLAETWGVRFEAGAALILLGMVLAERR